MKQKWTIFFIGIVIVGIMLGILYTEQQGVVPKTTPTPTTTTQSLPSLYTPSFPVFYQDEPKNVIFSLSQTIAPLPESLPVYRGLAINTASPAATLVKTLNLTNRSATPSSNTGGEVVWNNQTYTLVLSPKSLSLTLTSPLITSLSAQRMYAGDTALLAQSLLPSPYTLSSPKETPQIPDGIVGIDRAKPLTRVSYNALINNTYPVVGVSGGPRFSMVVDENNKAYSLFFSPPPLSPTTIRSIPILTLSEALQGLNAGKGRLAGISIDIGDAMWEGSTDFSNVSLSAMETAYYLQEDGITMVPVGVFYGLTSVEGSQQRVIYLLYLGK